MRSRALVSMKLWRLPESRPTGCLPSFLPHATTYAKRRDWPNSFKAGSLRPAPLNSNLNNLGRSFMTLTREQIRELAEFQDEKSCAVSFYFQPSTPRNKAHKEERILVKDLVRDALRTLETKDKKDAARSDTDRILQLSGELRSNGTHGKAVFACAAKNVWREYDLPASLPATQLFVDRRFHLKPIAHLLGASPLLGVVLVDRHRARIFELRLGELTEREDLFHPLTRRGRSDGYAGYDGGHAQRRVEDETRQHFKNVAEALKGLLEKGVFEKWILACQDAHGPLR